MTTRIVGAIVAALSIATSSIVGISTPASASPSTTSSGYIYHLTNTSPSHFNRYNIVEGVDEQIGTVGSSCDFLNSANRIADFEVDTSRHVAYFLHYQYNWPGPSTNSIRQLDLETGTCSVLIQESEDNANGRKPSWRGITIDVSRNLLFFIDNQGFPDKDNSGHQNAVNETIHYVDLNAGTPVDTVLPVVKKTNTPGPGVSAETTDITFGHDISIAGDYAYIEGKNGRMSTACAPSPECEAFIESTFGALTDPSEESTAVFRVRLFDAATHNLITGTPVQSEKIFSLLPSESTDAEMITVVVNDGYAYFSTFVWQEGGISKFRLSDFTTGSGTPVTARTEVVENYSYDITYGFAVAPSTVGGDFLFFTDRLDSPPWRLVWVQESGTAATSATETQASSNTDQFGQIQYSDSALPNSPVISSVSRDNDTTATITFSTPADALVGSQYSWVAVGSDSSEVTGTCTVSPCTATGLDPTVTYTVTMRQQWMSGAMELLHSLKSEPVAESASFESVSKSFGGFVTMTASLTPKIKRSVNMLVATHPGASSASCVGFVGNNYLGVPMSELRDLARKRARNVCTYIHRLDSDIEVGELTLVISRSEHAAIRKVSVTLD